MLGLIPTNSTSIPGASKSGKVAPGPPPASSGFIVSQARTGGVRYWVFGVQSWDRSDPSDRSEHPIPNTEHLLQQIRHHRAFFFQLGHGGAQLPLAERVEVGVLLDLVAAVAEAAKGKRADEALGNAVAAVGGNGRAEPIVSGCRLAQAADMIDDRVRRGERRG